MRPVVLEVALEYRDIFSFVKLDVITQRQKTTEYRIRGTPTYIVFENGKMIDQLIGAKPKAKLVEGILGILGIEGTE